MVFILPQLLLKKYPHFDIINSSYSIWNSSFFVSVLPVLIQHTSSFDICAKHGGMLALGEVIHALSLFCEENGSEKYLPDEEILQRE